MSTAPVPPAVPVRTDQRPTAVHALLKLVRQGLMAPATGAFQRPNGWRPEDVEALAQSVLNGFPLGPMLAWRSPYAIPSDLTTDRPTLAGDRLGPLAIPPAPSLVVHHRSIDLLLTGQNRLAALAWMTLDPDRPDVHPLPDLSGDDHHTERTTWCSGRTLMADALGHRIRFMTPVEASATLCLPVHRIAFTRVATLNQATQEQEAVWAQRFGARTTVHALAWFDRAYGAFRQAWVPHTVLVNASVDDAHRALRHQPLGENVAPSIDPIAPTAPMLHPRAAP